MDPTQAPKCEPPDLTEKGRHILYREGPAANEQTIMTWHPDVGVWSAKSRRAGPVVLFQQGWRYYREARRSDVDDSFA